MNFLFSLAFDVVTNNNKCEEDPSANVVEGDKVMVVSSTLVVRSFSFAKMEATLKWQEYIKLITFSKLLMV